MHILIQYQDIKPLINKLFNHQPEVLTIFWGWALHGAEHKIPKSISEKEITNKMSTIFGYKENINNRVHWLLVKAKGNYSYSQPLGLERKLFEVDHHEQHEVAQKRFLVLLLRNLEQSGQRNYDIPEACQHKVALPKYHFHILFWKAWEEPQQLLLKTQKNFRRKIVQHNHIFKHLTF